MKSTCVLQFEVFQGMGHPCYNAWQRNPYHGLERANCRYHHISEALLHSQENLVDLGSDQAEWYDISMLTPETGRFLAPVKSAAVKQMQQRLNRVNFAHDFVPRINSLRSTLKCV